MFQKITRLSAAALLCFGMGQALAQDAPYVEGAVINVSSLRTQPGQFDNYISYLATTYRKIMDEAKAQGIILDYSFYSAQPRSPDDPDLYIVTVYPNYAALDGLDQRMEAISNKVFGSSSGAASAAVDREKLRKALGSETMREF